MEVLVLSLVFYPISRTLDSTKPAVVKFVAFFDFHLRIKELVNLTEF